jgi:hypothetical protein
VTRAVAALAVTWLVAAVAHAAPAAATPFEAGVRVEGAVTVEYAGTPAAGCAASGLCGVSGVALWTPPKTALLRYERGERHVVASLDFFFEPAATRAQVMRRLPDGTAGTCTDARQTSVEVSTVARGRGEAALGLRGAGLGRADLFTTACTGPRPEDLAAALPVQRVPLAILRRDGATVDLRGERSFSAGGLAGVVRSTMVLRVDRSFPARDASGGRRGDRRPVLLATFAIERVTGAIRTGVRADGDPARCGPLDACGLAGTLTERLPVRAGSLRLVSAGGSRGARRRFRAALGLLRPGERRPHGPVEAIGVGVWRTAGGTVSADLARPGGVPGCRDRAAAPAAQLFLDVRGRHLEASVLRLSDLRTRCPGPYGTVFGTAASGRVPLRALHRRRIVLRLRQTSRRSSGGFRTVTTPALKVVLRRTSVRVVRGADSLTSPGTVLIR